MKIVYIGRVSLAGLEESVRFDRPLPKTKWGFGLGTQFVLGLLRRGHEVIVVDTLYGMTRTERYEPLADLKLRLYLVPERSFKMQMLTLYRREVRAMRAVLAEAKPDVVFAHWTYQNAYAGLTSGYPTLVVAHDSPWTVLWTFRNAYALFHAIYAQLFVFPRLKHVTAVSPHIADDLHKLNRFKGEIPVIPNGIEIGGRDQKSGIRGVRKEAKTIVCVSQWGRLKNVKTLAWAFERLRRRHPDWRLVVFGQGTREGLERAARRHEVCLDGVALRGWASRTEIDRTLSEEADVFCSPTLEESFGMVFVEAMIRGVPCMGGENSGAVAWVMGGGGVTCDVQDPEKLSGCLEGLMLNWELRKKLSEAGVERVNENFDIDRVVDLYEKELGRIVGEGR